jgi:hypothetical protein
MYRLFRTALPGAAAAAMIGVAILGAVEDADAAGRGRSGGARSGYSGRHHHHSHSAIFVGGFVSAPIWPWYAYAPSAPPPAYAAPLQYIERSEAADADWFYCRQSSTYFPYVTDCAGGWERVQPQPPQ